MDLDDLFELAPDVNRTPELIWLAPNVPVITIDNIFRWPEQLRDYALTLDYAPPPYPYPGRLAAIPPSHPSLHDLRSLAFDLVNNVFLPQVPVVSNGRRLLTCSRLHTDFGIVDVAPEDLSPVQRIPHTDPVPIFGLIYLNREERGGTLFFKQVADVSPDSYAPGYPTVSSDAFVEVARIEPVFNRLVIYPGFVLHSGDIGSWINGPERHAHPRLTQRLAFI